MNKSNSDDEALSEARRSTANPPLADIDRWDGATYVPCQGAERNAAMEAQMSRSRSLLAQQSGCLAIYGKNLSPSLNACRLKGGSGLAAQ